MDSDIDRDVNREMIYCADDDESRIFCDICDKLVEETF